MDTLGLQVEYSCGRNLELDDFGVTGEEIRQFLFERLEVLGLGVGFECFLVFVLLEEPNRILPLNIRDGPISAPIFIFKDMFDSIPISMVDRLKSEVCSAESYREMWV